MWHAEHAYFARSWQRVHITTTWAAAVPSAEGSTRGRVATCASTPAAFSDSRLTW